MQDGNKYESALRIIGDCLEPFSAGKNFPFFGFGACMNETKDTPYLQRMNSIEGVNYAFPLNGNQDDPSIVGLENLIETYRSNVEKTSPGRPCYLAPILRNIQGMINKKELVYHYILLLVAGPNVDMDQTREVCVELSHYPCQITVIGIGNGDFSELE